MKKYQIIYADPPWLNTDRSSAGKRGAIHKFSQMKTSDVCTLRVKDIVAKDAALFLWTPMVFLKDALEAIKAWGFTYKTCAFVWVKMSKGDKPLFGMGSWTRQNAELCLLGIKGKLEVKDHGVSQIVLHPRGKFAEKPSIVRALIERLYGSTKRVELFARHETRGWDVWGDEVKSDIKL